MITLYDVLIPVLGEFAVPGLQGCVAGTPSSPCPDSPKFLLKTYLWITFSHFDAFLKNHPPSAPGKFSVYYNCCLAWQNWFAGSPAPCCDVLTLCLAPLGVSWHYPKWTQPTLPPDPEHGWGCGVGWGLPSSPFAMSGAGIEMILLFFKFAVEVVRAYCSGLLSLRCVEMQRFPSTASPGMHPEVGRERSRIKNKCKCILTC